MHVVKVQDFSTEELMEALRERGFHIARTRAEVRVFAEAMEEQLASNEHKGGWSEDTAEDLLERLVEEVDELRVEIKVRVSYDPARVLKEAADVANFAMMVADVCGGLRADDGGGDE